MASVSKAQRRMMGRAEHDPAYAESRGIHMSKKQFRDFSTTKEKGLPEHVKKKPNYKKMARAMGRKV